MNDYLDRIEAQLTELTERGAHQRRRVRRGALPRVAPGGPRRPRRPQGSRRLSEGLAFLAAAAVVAAVVGIVLVNAHSSKPHPVSSGAPATARSKTSTTATHTRTATATASTTTTTAGIATPSPGQFYPQSFTAISELTWWVLGQAQCPSGQQAPCGKIMLTTDGGVHFTAVGAPHAALSSPAEPARLLADPVRRQRERVRVRTQPVRHPRRRPELAPGEHRRLRQRPRDLRRRGIRDRRRVGQRRRRGPADALAGERGRVDRGGRGRRRIRRVVGAGLDRADPVRRRERDRLGPARLLRQRRELHELPVAKPRARVPVRGARAAGRVGALRDRHRERRVALDGRRRRTSPPPSPAAGSACRTRRRSRPLPRTRRWSATSSCT